MHAVVVPDLDIVDKVGKICVAARGDGVVNIIDLDLEPQLATLKSKVKAKADSESADKKDKNLLLDYSMGGHMTAVSSV